jgi:hypothetical protein
LAAPRKLAHKKFEGGAMTLEEFMELVDECAKDRRDFTIPNSSPEHARILIAKLFDTAKREVCLVTGRLVESTKGKQVYAWANLIAAAKTFLRRPNSVLRIISIDPIQKGNQNRFLKALLSDPLRVGDIVIYRGDKLVKKLTKQHFMVTDMNAYRFETSNTKVNAIANFGDKKTAKWLRQRFEVISTYLHNEKRFRILRTPAFSPTLAF